MTEAILRGLPEGEMPGDVTGHGDANPISSPAAGGGGRTPRNAVAGTPISTHLVGVVHDLRAPLSVISGLADGLSIGDFGELPPAARQAVTALVAKAREMSALLEGLLELERPSDAGGAPRDLRTRDLRRVARTAIARAQPLARLGGDTVELSTPTAVTASVAGHPVGRVLDNLINNALTHNRHPVHVRVTVGRDEDGVHVRVEDDGEGVAAGVREAMFEPGARLDSAEGGSGLGLYLCRSLAERIGGALRHEEVVPHGSAFVLDLPGS